MQDAAPTGRGAIQQGLRRCLRALTLVAATALALMMLITVADIVLRNLFSLPILGTYDLVETMMVFVVFLGIGEAFLNDGHITVDVIDHAVSPRTVALLKLLALAASAIFLGVLLRYMLVPAWDAYVFGDRKPDLPIPLIALWVPCLVGIASAFVAVLFKLGAGLKAGLPHPSAKQSGETA